MRAEPIEDVVERRATRALAAQSREPQLAAHVVNRN
jgi:hypothetical protein